ncbi:MAG: PAS domain S-box protein, partial [Deltaproteobacteria bacterium]|nr:PAS domain S-box protein [Deltaproteobacteria bacterium]
MAKKPTYKELAQKINEVEKERIEHKLAEDALRLEKNKLQALMDGLARTQIGIDIVGTDYKILFQNQALQERFGNLTGELCYKKYMGLEKPCDFCPMIEAIKNNKVESVQLTGADGRNYELFSAPLPNQDGTVDSAIEVVFDITERKRAEEELRTRQTYLESVLYSAPDAIVTLDASHHVIEWNIGAEQIFGYTRHEAVGKNLDDLVIGPDRIDESKKLTTQVLSGGKVSPRETVRYRKDGTPVNVIVAGSPIIIKGKLQGVVAVYTDITSRKIAEKEKKNLESQLLQAQKMEAIGTLAGGIAHNFN